MIMLDHQYSHFPIHTEVTRAAHTSGHSFLIDYPLYIRIYSNRWEGIAKGPYSLGDDDV